VWLKKLVIGIASKFRYRFYAIKLSWEKLDLSNLTKVTLFNLIYPNQLVSPDLTCPDLS